MLFRDRAYIHLEQVDSTNNYAANLLKVSLPPDGTVITAQLQTNGKGQRGAQWLSNNGDNLLMSIVCYPSFLTQSEPFLLSKIVSLAVAQSIEDFTHLETYIKWPNDIIVRDKKIAGILIELNWTDRKMASAIIGIGLNVNQRRFPFSKATAIRQLTGNEELVVEWMDRILKHFDRLYLKATSGQSGDIDRLYKHKLYRLFTPTTFIWKGELVSGTITGVDLQGRLKLMLSGGTEITCDLKEISMEY